MMKVNFRILLLSCLLSALSLQLQAIPSGYGKVTFYINVQNCLVYIAGKTIEGGNGTASIYLREGSYGYEITSDKYYHGRTGTLAVVSGEETSVKVNLRPAFGSLTVDADKLQDMEGALIFVDGIKSGDVPCTVERVLSGPHSVVIVKKNYLPYEYKVIIQEGKDEYLSPVLTANYSPVRITTAPGAEIWANSQKLGVGEWTGKLEAGVYNFESQQTYFISGSLEVEIKSGSDIVEIQLPAPTPQYGSLKIEFSSSLISSDVYLDDIKVGTVPVFLEKVQAGHHNIRLEKKSGGSVRKYGCEVDVLPGQTATVSGSQFTIY